MAFNCPERVKARKILREHIRKAIRKASRDQSIVLLDELTVLNELAYETARFLQKYEGKGEGDVCKLVFDLDPLPAAHIPTAEHL